jgi:hypothetical protein
LNVAAQFKPHVFAPFEVLKSKAGYSTSLALWAFEKVDGLSIQINKEKRPECSGRFSLLIILVTIPLL